MSQSALHEISDSQTNTRSQHAMGPPSISGIKRGPHGMGMTDPQDHALDSSCSQATNKAGQPEAKARKTLADKAVEYPNATSKSGIVAPTPARNMVRGTSLKDIQSVSHGFFDVDFYAHTGPERGTTTTEFHLQSLLAIWDIRIIPYADNCRDSS